MDNKTRRQFAYFVDILRSQNCISDLDKDILDTWNELSKNPFDMDSARMQELHNRAVYPDIYAAVLSNPTTVVKNYNQANQSDLIYSLTCQLEFLLTKRFGHVVWELLNQNES